MTIRHYLSDTGGTCEFCGPLPVGVTERSKSDHLALELAITEPLA